MLFLLGRLVGVVAGSACWCCCFCWVDLLFLLGRLVVFVGLVLLFGWLVGVVVGSACWCCCCYTSRWYGMVVVEVT